MNTKSSSQIHTRQLAFFLAFFLPVGTLVELPSLLSRGAAGDLLAPAIIGTVFEFPCFFPLFLFATRNKQNVFGRVRGRFGRWAEQTLCILLSIALLLFATLPLFDLEKYSHAVFSDTEPTFFSFAPFFLLSGFLCTKGLCGVGRSADLAIALFLIPFLFLLSMATPLSDFSRILPFFEYPISRSFQAFWRSLPYFSGGILLLPLMCGYEYQPGDGKKLVPAFIFGSGLFLAFIAIFFGLYGATAGKEHYALAKIAQFFPALDTLGRIDLLLVYCISVHLFFFTALPLQLAVDCIQRCISKECKILLSALLNSALFFAVLFLNRHYDAIFDVCTRTLPPVYAALAFLPPTVLCLLFWKKQQKDGGRDAMKSKKGAKYAR